MSVSDSSIFASKPFKFIIQGTPLYVHAALVADCSGPLDRMMNGHLAEAKQGFALLDDVDEATFVSFIRWTYTKDYPAPDHTLVETGQGEAAQKDAWIPERQGSWGTGWTPGSTTKKKKKKAGSKGYISLKESFIDECDDWKCTLPSGPHQARSNLHPQEDYSEVFLSHARLYVFAEKYDIEPLKKLCLHKLQLTLAIYTLYPERVADITSLLEYVYANTAETVDGTEDIRTMLAHYVGTELDTLIKYGGIKDLMLDNGDMLGDFLKMFTLNVN